MNRKYSKSTFERLLKRLDRNLDSKVEIIAIGGTALSLTDIRSFTRDIDICYLKCKSPIDFAQIVVDVAREIGINNLFRVELPAYWRMLYTLTNNEQIEIIAFVIDIIDHPTYDKKFGYGR